MWFVNVVDETIILMPQVLTRICKSRLTNQLGLHGAEGQQPKTFVWHLPDLLSTPYFQVYVHVYPDIYTHCKV